MTDIAADIKLADSCDLRGNRRAVFLLTRMGWSLQDLRLLFGSPQDRNLRSAVEALSCEGEGAVREYSGAELRNGAGLKSCFKNSGVKGPGAPVSLDDRGRERSPVHATLVSAEQYADCAWGLDCSDEDRDHTY